MLQLPAHPSSRRLPSLRRGGWLPATAVRLGVTVLCLATVAPLAWMVWASLLPAQALLGGQTPTAWRVPELGNYWELWQRVDLVRMLRNSLLVAAAVIVSQAVTGTAGGYLLARFRFTGRRIVAVVLLAGLFVPDALTWVPAYRVLAYTGLLDTLGSLIVPFAAGGLGTLIVVKHVRSLPSELLDAARMDGCSHTQLLIRVVLPLIRPGIQGVAIAAFLFSWSSFTWPLLMIHSANLHTLPVGLALLQDEFATQVNLVMALAVTMSVPPALVLLFLVRGMTSTTSGPSVAVGDPPRRTRHG